MIQGRITQKALDSLDKAELAVFEWQYHLCGDFRKALWEAIMRADDLNLARLRMGFPAEVNGYQLYTYTDGWWPAVEKKVTDISREEEVKDDT